MKLYFKFVSKGFRTDIAMEIYRSKFPLYLLKQTNTAFLSKDVDCQCEALVAIINMFFYFENKHGDLIRLEGMIKLFFDLLGEDWKNKDLVDKISIFVRNSSVELLNEVDWLFDNLAKPLERFLSTNWEKYCFSGSAKVNFALCITHFMTELKEKYEEIEGIFGRFVVEAVNQPVSKIDEDDYKRLISRVRLILEWENEYCAKKMLSSRVSEENYSYELEDEGKGEFECLVREITEELDDN